MMKSNSGIDFHAEALLGVVWQPRGGSVLRIMPQGTRPVRHGMHGAETLPRDAHEVIQMADGLLHLMAAVFRLGQSHAHLPVAV